jgi:hypothetical protein
MAIDDTLNDVEAKKCEYRLLHIINAVDSEIGGILGEDFSLNGGGIEVKYKEIQNMAAEEYYGNAGDEYMFWNYACLTEHFKYTNMCLDIFKIRKILGADCAIAYVRKDKKEFARDVESLNEVVDKDLIKLIAKKDATDECLKRLRERINPEMLLRIKIE